MAPWTILFRNLEDALYTGADRLSALVAVRDDLNPADDPLLDEPVAA